MRKYIAASTVALTITAAAVAGTALAGAASADTTAGRHGGGYVVTSPGGAPVRACPSKSCPAIDWIPAGGLTGGKAEGNWLKIHSGGYAWLGKLSPM
ncbi:MULTISPECIES: hypothetical protein [Nonomuraea]|uniref:SH3 domain-containing protein n=1 Tax=Nonomuraea mangrovi TaxID=2316207 RepID=A0ABW4SYZ9_9ACTN